MKISSGRETGFSRKFGPTKISRYTVDNVHVGPRMEVYRCILWLTKSNVVFLILQKDEVYLNLVLDFVPETVYRVIRHHSKAKQIMPTLYVKVSAWI